MADSALMGQPPNTEQDSRIVRGLWYIMGFFNNVDVSKGMVGVFPSRPPNYVHESKAGAIIAVGTIMLALQFFVTAFRLYLRYFSPRMVWGWDDWAIIPGVLLALWCQIQTILMVTTGGAGLHIWEVTYSQFNTFQMYTFMRGFFMWPAFGIIKISISLFNLRLTAIASRGWRYANRFFLGVNVAYTILAIVWLLAACKPVRFAFDKETGPDDPVPKCYNPFIISRVLSVTHSVMDFLLLMTPIWVICKIKLRRGNKIRLIILFCTGSVSCISSILRIKATDESHLDTTWHFTTLLAWNTTDLTMSVIVASLPVYNSLFSRRGSEFDSHISPSDMQLSFPSLHQVETSEEKNKERHVERTAEVDGEEGRNRTENQV